MIDRKLLKLPFMDPRGPRWIDGQKWKCPTCATGVLSIQKDSLKVEETRKSKRDRGHPEWDPDWISYVFSCLLQCSSDNCKEWVSCAGKGVVDYDISYDEFGEGQQEWEAFFFPKYFSPHLRIISYPRDTPDDVANELEESFTLLFCSPSSASNHLRIAVENLLTSLKIKRYKKNNKPGQRRIRLGLHERIRLLPNKLRHLQDLLLAVKWLGDAGSHSTGSITMDDVLDAYEIMEEVLQDLYRKKSGAQYIAKAINKKKGPRKRK